MVYTTSDARKKIVHGCNNEESRPAKSEWRGSLCYERSETESVKDGNEYNNTVMCAKRKEELQSAGISTVQMWMEDTTRSQRLARMVP